jgi:hypothetical protein
VCEELSHDRVELRAVLAEKPLRVRLALVCDATDLLVHHVEISAFAWRLSGALDEGVNPVVQRGLGTVKRQAGKGLDVLGPSPSRPSRPQGASTSSNLASGAWGWDRREWIPSRVSSHRFFDSTRGEAVTKRFRSNRRRLLDTLRGAWRRAVTPSAPVVSKES